MELGRHVRPHNRPEADIELLQRGHVDGRQAQQGPGMVEDQGHILEPGESERAQRLVVASNSGLLHIDQAGMGDEVGVELSAALFQTGHDLWQGEGPRVRWIVEPTPEKADSFTEPHAINSSTASKAGDGAGSCSSNRWISFTVPALCQPEHDLTNQFSRPEDSLGCGGVSAGHLSVFWQLSMGFDGEGRMSWWRAFSTSKGGSNARKEHGTQHCVRRWEFE